MKASELRLGNWIQINVRNESHMGQVCKIEDDCIWAGSNGGVLVPLQFLNPIPLTPEWLEKAGAEKIREGRYFIGINPVTDDYLLVIGQNADGFYFQNAGHPLRWVHQLQNLCHALTGEELQFKD